MGNDSITKEAVTRDQMKKFPNLVHDGSCFCKYYKVGYILFHTGMRISEFCKLQSAVFYCGKIRGDGV